MSILKINTALQIGKSAQEVYEALVNPKHMNHYFISESSGIMEEGKKLIWKFPEFKEEFEIHIIQLTPPSLIIFEWPSDVVPMLQVKIMLENLSDSATLVRITEGEVVQSDQGLQWLARNTEGWANFLACLKAYLEFGVNLRKGGFDFMKNIE